MPANKIKRELGTFQPTSLDELSEYASAGHYEVPVQLLTDPSTGVFGVRASHGLYRIGIDAQGRQICLFSADPDNLMPVSHRDEAFRRNYAPGYYLDPARLNQIHVVSAREERTIRKWILPAIDAHNNDLAANLLEKGYLYRLSDNLWSSGAIAYKLSPAPARTVARLRGRIAQDGGDIPEDQLYILRCYTAPGGFPDMDDDFLRTPTGRMLGALAPQAIVTRAEAERIIADDFVRRADLVMRGRDPDLLGRDRKDPSMQSALSPLGGGYITRVKLFARHAAARLLQAAYMQYSNIDGKTITVRLLKAIGLTTLQLLTKGITAAFGQVLGEILQPVLGELTGKERRDRRTRDIAEKFSMPGSSAVAGKKNYDRIDPEKGKLIRLMEASELNIKSALRRDIREHLGAEWAEENILSLLGGPPGSIIERRRMGNMDVAYVSEPNGLDICYLVGRNIAYAVSNPDNAHPLTPALHRRRKLMVQKGDIVKVWAAPDGTLQSRGLAQDDFMADIARETENVPDDFTPLPPLKHDLHLLAEFQKRAGLADEAPQSLLRRAFSFIHAANDNQKTDARRDLETLLDNRGGDGRKPLPGSAAPRP